MFTAEPPTPSPALLPLLPSTLAPAPLTGYRGDDNNAPVALLQHGHGGPAQDHVTQEVDLHVFAHVVNVIDENSHRVVGVGDVVQNEHV